VRKNEVTGSNSYSKIIARYRQDLLAAGFTCATASRSQTSMSGDEERGCNRGNRASVMDRDLHRQASDVMVEEYTIANVSAIRGKTQVHTIKLIVYRARHGCHQGQLKGR